MNFKAVSPKRQRLPGAGLKATIAIAVLSMVSTTAAIVYFPWLLTSRKNVDSVIGGVNEAIAQGTSREVVRIFNDVQATLELTKQAFSNQLIPLDNPQKRETFYFDLLATHPNLTWIEFGFPNGNHFGVQRENYQDEDGGKNLRLNIISRLWNPQTKTATKTIIPYSIIGNQFLPGTKKVEFGEQYNATQRDWYQIAEQNPSKIAWTNVYVFRTSKTPGISASLVMDKAGKRLGVISIAFELQQISDYLKQLQDKREGAIFLVNEKSELIAFSDSQKDINKPEKDAKGKLKMQLLENTKNQNLKFANQVLKIYGLSLEAIAKNQVAQTQYIYRNPETNERYYISFSPLQYPENFKSLNANYPQWVVGTIIPESIYVQEINQNKRRLFYIIAGFVIVAAGFSLFMADRLFAQPILKIAQAAEKIETEQFEAVNLASVTQRQDELGHLALVFENMARKVYTREQELKQQVQALKIEIDESNRQQQVQEIVESEFFQTLREKTQQQRRQAIDSLESASHQGKIISIHSYRGGTGKSNLTANIATTLAQQGYRVGIMDTDLASPGIHVIFGLSEINLNPCLNDYLWGRCNIEETAHSLTSRLKKDTIEGAQLYLIPASIKPGEISKILQEGYDVDVLKQGIERLILKLNLDYLLIDTHPGINEETLLSITISDVLILILRPDQQDFQGTAVTVDVARKLHVPQLLSIINKAPTSLDFQQLQEKVEATYNIDVVGILPHSDEMMLLGSQGVFVSNYPAHSLTQIIEAIVQRIEQELIS